MSEPAAQQLASEYFANHERRERFPWSLYHRPISTQIARTLRQLGESPSVLVVGCGLEPYVPGVPRATWFACDVDERAIVACKRLFPTAHARLAVCPSEYELPTSEAFLGPFDAVIAKDVIEHVTEPDHWAPVLTARLRPGGIFVLSTPNYGRDSTLALIERTVLEAIARRDGYSRRHIHPSPFNRMRLGTLEVGDGVAPLGIATTWNRWALVASWRRGR